MFVQVCRAIINLLPFSIHDIVLHDASWHIPSIGLDIGQVLSYQVGRPR
jgi:hypothetical protein